MERLDLCVLGPLRVYRDDVPIRLGPQLTRLLSVLALEAGRWVPAARLVELLWDPVPPGSAATTLRSHVSHLRRALRAGAPDCPSVVTTMGSGPGRSYRLDLDDERMDFRRFEERYAEGRLLLGSTTAEGAAAIQEALALWRGPAFADVSDRPFALPQIARLDAMRLAARRAYAEALISLGRHTEVVCELTGAVAAEPYDEGLRRLLALALYHEQRVDQAATVCRDGLVLLRQRGIDAPCLAELQRTILQRRVPTAGGGSGPYTIRTDGIPPPLSSDVVPAAPAPGTVPSVTRVRAFPAAPTRAASPRRPRPRRGRR
ncbi:BTAD domain-containing putative transcriptional regulator [Micromonosporaceae bacterium B7E4]